MRIHEISQIFYQKSFFGWMLTVVRKGIQKDLNLNNLYKAPDKHQSEKLGNRLEKNWNNELLNAKEKKTKPIFLRAIIKTFFCEFMIHGFFFFILHVPIWCSSPLLLGHFVSLFSDPFSEEKKIEMCMFGILIAGFSTISVSLFHHLNFGLAVIGMRIRVACSSLVYRKITRLNHKSLGQTAAGQVVNLLSNDVNRFDLLIPYLHALWIMPFQVSTLTYIMWRQAGVSCLAGIISMAIIALPLQGYLAKVMGDYRLRISKKTDRRVKFMDEIISGIQVIKMYAWEKPFEIMVKIARRVEIVDIKKASYLRGILGSCMIFLERLTLFFTVICYVLLGNNITPEKVFSLAQAFNILQYSMAISYPIAISIGVETLISIKRLQEFLLLEEKKLTPISNDIKNTGVIINGVNASWTDDESTLKDVNLQIPSGGLCAVIGPVGAGKSSLLQLFLGELVAKTGKIQIEKEISYCSQNPWLFQSTVRNNILFGKSFDKLLYKKIVKVCALERDFEQFPHGDQTIVGEKGVSLSGGQRARINLARAVYTQADIYLMDDPLSAVDTHVGKHLFEKCINQYLKGKTRILVTHQLQYLKKANLIVVINNGKIEEQGTFEELLNSKLDFSKLLVDSVEDVDKHIEVQLDNVISKHVRKVSVLSNKSDISDRFLKQDQEEEEEEEVDQCIDSHSKPFKEYLLAIKNVFFLIIVIILMIISQALCAGADYWVAFWTSQENVRYKSNSSSLRSWGTTPNDLYSSSVLLASKNSTHDDIGPSYLTRCLNIDIYDYVQIDDEEHKLLKTEYAMYLYGIIIATAVILTIVRSVIFFKACMMSSINLHSKIFHKLLKAPMRFFDTNSSGRILNRFSKDMGAIDEVLPRVLMDAVSIFLIMCGILVNVSISNPYIIIAIIILGGVFLIFRSRYIATAKVIKHLEGKAKSPVFSHINSSLNGIITIRASKAEKILIKEFDEHQDVHTAAWYLLMACMSSFGLWLDLISVAFTACIIFSFVVLHSSFAVDGSLVGLAIYQSMILIGMLQHGMRQSAEVINQLISVERVLQYTKIDQEGPFETPHENVLKETWPKEGLLEFKNLYLTYVKEDPPVLMDLNFIVHPGQKIGIVGRTGAGKSSLIAALFRLAPLKGSIFIDGVDTTKFGLTDLRKKISIIPQEPVLFSATLRYNLDPFNEYQDDQLWKALEQVELKDSINSLDFMVAEGGGNFSLGQRQLVCLARAALRNNKILVLDEATANVDPRTDAFIQSTIRKRFKECTVLTIAHRLNTIMDSDKVLVMSFGNIVEFDHPHKLLQIQDGYFHQMVLETGPVMSMQLKEIAFNAYSGADINDLTE